MDYIITAILTLNIAMSLFMCAVCIKTKEENTRIGCAIIGILHAASAWVCLAALYGANCAC